MKNYFHSANRSHFSATWLVSILLLGFSLLQLTGCSKHQSLHHKPDGAPKRAPRNLHKTPDAVPRVEPLSSCGNRYKKGKNNSYVVKGKRYHVMASSKGYRVRGHCSWYGTKFHGRKTSSGEKYNMYAMTAAHPTLPLPSYIRVTNLSNGKCAVVKVTDRGPFKSKRILDVSYAAAARLGMLGTGTAHVEVESVDPRDHGGSVPRRGKIYDTTAVTPLLAHNEEAEQNAIIQQEKRGHAAKHASTKNSSGKKLANPLAPVVQPKLNAAVPTPRMDAKLTKPKLDAALPQAKSPAATPKKKDKFYLKLGKFSYREKAENLVKEISKLSSLPTQISQQGDPKSPLFHVRLGPVRNDDEAVKLTQALARARLPAAVVIREQP